MAMLRSSYDLPSLRISQRARSYKEGSVVLFEMVRGRETPFEVARCSTAELGLPDRLVGSTYAESRDSGQGWMTDESFRLPPEVLARLTEGANQVGMSDSPPHTALWLELASPRGSLYVLPWERLLAPLGRPVLRLPNFLIRPQSSASALEIVICATGTGDADADADVVQRLCRAWQKRAGHTVHLQIFTDPAVFRVLRKNRSISGDAVLHDPYSADPTATPPASPNSADLPGSATAVSDPWLGWIRNTLGDTAVDVVQLVTAGCLLGSQGGVPLLQGGTADQRVRRVIGSAEVAGFLGELGAWGLTLTGVGPRASMPGLRELADTVARLVPGVVQVHDYRIGNDDLDIGHAVELAAGITERITTQMPYLTCWVHPAFVDVPDSDLQRLLMSPDGHSTLLGSATKQALSQDSTPSWVAAGSRFIETQQSRWLGDTGLAGLESSSGGSSDADAAAALGSVARILDRHAARYLSEGTS